MLLNFKQRVVIIKLFFIQSFFLRILIIFVVVPYLQENEGFLVHKLAGNKDSGIQVYANGSKPIRIEADCPFQCPLSTN